MPDNAKDMVMATFAGDSLALGVVVLFCGTVPRGNSVSQHSLRRPVPLSVG